MKIMGITLTVIVLTSFLFCSTPTYTVPSESPDAVLFFGRGGGYTGMVTEYALLSNGQLFRKKDRNGTFEAFKKVDKDLAKQAFSNYEHLGIGKMKINAPGNVYFYIRYEHEEGGHEIVWGGGKVKNEVKLFYDILNRLVKEQKK